MKKSIYFITLSIVLLPFVFNVKAQLPAPSATEVLENNNKISITNTGELWSYNKSSGKYFFPNDTTKPDSMKTAIIFASGLWMSARDEGGNLHLAAQFYNDTTEYYAGPIDASGNVSIATCTAWNRMFTCSRAEVNTFRSLVSSGGVPVPLFSISTNILLWPGKGNPNLIALGYELDHDIAPFVDYNSDGIYNPADGDFPCIKGDKAVFYVINDKGPHNITTGDPLGVEIHVLCYVYNTTNIINNTSFYDISILNRSVHNYTDYSLGLFVDNDLGCYSNDYVGCQPSKNMAISYNGTSYDGNCQTRGFLDQLPIVGLKMLQSPLNSLGVPTGMSSFNFFINAPGPQGDAHSLFQYNNYMNGLWSDGSDFTLDGNGYGGTIPTKFIYPGNPADSTEWSECHNQVSGRNLPFDRRFLMTTGPYNIAVGQKLDFTYAVIATMMDSSQFLNPDYDATINPKADSVQAFYDAMFLYCNDGIAGLADEAISISKASVYPNPLEGNQLNIIFDNDMPFGTYDLYISNVNGQLIYSNKLEVNEHAVQIDLSENNLSKGFYYVKICSSNKIVNTRFLVSR